MLFKFEFKEMNWSIEIQSNSLNSIAWQSLVLKIWKQLSLEDLLNDIPVPLPVGCDIFSSTHKFKKQVNSLHSEFFKTLVVKCILNLIWRWKTVRKKTSKDGNTSLICLAIAGYTLQQHWSLFRVLFFSMKDTFEEIIFDESSKWLTIHSNTTYLFILVERERERSTFGWSTFGLSVCVYIYIYIYSIYIHIHTYIHTVVDKIIRTLVFSPA